MRLSHCKIKYKIKREQNGRPCSRCACGGVHGEAKAKARRAGWAVTSPDSAASAHLPAPDLNGPPHALPHSWPN